MTLLSGSDRLCIDHTLPIRVNFEMLEVSVHFQFIRNLFQSYLISAQYVSESE